ncbi:MAG: hypothetical protein AAGA10_02870 [Bacteroidota bacterium]
MENTLELAREIKNQLKKKISLEKLILIGNADKKIAFNSELDFVVVVNDKLDKFEFVNITSELAVDCISKYKIMIQFFPIHKMNFQLKSTAFIRSIKKNGIEI